MIWGPAPEMEKAMVGESIRHEERGELGIVRIPFANIDAIAVVTIEQMCVDMRAVTALDFRDVRFISSTGMSALLKFAVATRKKSINSSRSI